MKSGSERPYGRRPLRRKHYSVVVEASVDDDPAAFATFASMMRRSHLHTDQATRYPVVLRLCELADEYIWTGPRPVCRHSHSRQDAIRCFRRGSACWMNRADLRAAVATELRLAS
jgi:hypothetical protein